VNKAPGPEELCDRLCAFVAEREAVAREAVRASGLRRLAGGASRLLWSVDLELAGERLPLVLRQDPPGRVVPGGMETEFLLLRAAAEAGVPVPRVHWCDPEGDALGAPFFAMERLEGEAIPRRLLRDARYEHARRGMTAELGAILARVHAIDPEAEALRGRLARPPEGVSPAAAEVERIAQGVRAFAVEPHPVLDLAERWLRERAPAPPRLGFVHGDYRIGNVLFDEKGVRAILDWELAHVGDPVEDLGWLCVRAWRFGNDALCAGGVGTREELVSAYEAAGGAAVDPEALRFWEACGNFKLALVFITQARAYLDGAHRTVELASLGRRTAEAEEELLRILEGEA
jgi:aminoglycoside phosphotransferase (APT) family kinase protein